MSSRLDTALSLLDCCHCAWAGDQHDFLAINQAPKERFGRIMGYHGDGWLVLCSTAGLRVSASVNGMAMAVVAGGWGSQEACQAMRRMDRFWISSSIHQ